jgi:3D (Asp-Asp-Asp) domain-containing protein/peptidoglycan hydrolase CwlO-like protein
VRACPRTASHVRAALGGAAASLLLLASSADARDPDTLRSEVDGLRSANAAIDARSQSVLLELFALEAQLAAAEDRLAALRREAVELDGRIASARIHLELVRGTLREAHERLADRLRALYIEGETDPLAVLLGADSLEDAITTLDGLDSLARQDREILQQVNDARRDVGAALQALAARRSELRDLVRQAEVARATLARARAERSGYLARLAAKRRWNRLQISRLTARAEEIESRADELAAATRPPAPETAPPVVPSVPGRRLTVVATGYALRGATATGAPAGWGVVAVDPAVIPLGTRMTIPGYGEGIAADTGSHVRGAMIDVWFPTEAQARAWGRRTVTVTLH